MKKTISLISIFLVAVICFTSCSSAAKKIEWESLYLGNMLPEPKSLLCEINSNSENYLSIDVHKTKQDDFNNYVDLCEEMGFVVEPERDDNSFRAFNSQGFELSLYLNDDLIMSVYLNAPEKYDVFQWPDNTIAHLVPAPISSLGKIETINENNFRIKVAETTFDDYRNYITLCTQHGFNSNLNDYEKSFYAQNDDKYTIHIEYLGNKVMCITLSEPEYTVNIEVERVENLIFSTYDVDVSINNLPKGTLSNGEKQTYTATFNKGVYAIEFRNVNDSEVMGKAELNITKDENFSLKLYCHNSEIEVRSDDSVDVTATESETTTEAAVTNTTQPTETTPQAEKEPSTSQTTEKQTAKVTESNDNYYDNDSHDSIVVPDKPEYGENLVWVPTNGGTKYHNHSGCSNMIDPIQVSVETAKQNGYSPCGRCY